MTRGMFRRLISTVFLLLSASVFSDTVLADTHLGQPLGSLVTLRANAVSGTKHGEYKPGWDIVLPDGSTSKFEMPYGKALVITDVDWIYVISQFAAATGPDLFQPEYQLRLDLNNSNIYLSNPHAMVPSPHYGKEGYVIGGHDSLTGGLVISDPKVLSGLTAFIFPYIQAVVVPADDGKTSHVILHGYLIDNP